MKKRIWSVRETDEAAAGLISSVLGVRMLTARLLCARGQDTPEKAQSFLDISALGFHDPFLLTDMDKAVARINRAKENGERVCIYGDYDVDGVTATMALYSCLTSMSIKCSYFIPERIAEGYGLNMATVGRLAQTNDLLITVDTGITAVDEVEYAKSLGLDVIVTDHHSCRPTLPKAEAVVNPHRPDCPYPFKQLAGVGVVFKLICALSGAKNLKTVCEKYADIVAIGTIADVMPITDENRRIASMGISRLASTGNLGLRSLMACAGVLRDGKPAKKITSGTVGYVIAPRINAAGRITNASTAVELLLSKDSEQAYSIATRLCEINRQRQSTESEIYDQAREQIEENAMQGDNILVLSSDGWHQGVIGVVSSKITERFATPSILFSFDGNIGKGSGRSIKGFNLMDALSKCEDLLIEYGGHELAAGLSIERANLEPFRKRINEYSLGKLNREGALTLDIDTCVQPSEITLAAVKELGKLEPFGLQNPVPVLIVRDVTLTGVTAVSFGKHTKLRFAGDDGTQMSGMYFSCPTQTFPYEPGDRCDVVFNMDLNEYNGVESVQMLIKDIRLAEPMLTEITAEMEKYRCRWERLPGVPDVEDFRGVFKALRKIVGTGEKTLDLRLLASRIRVNGVRPGYCTIRIIIDVLEESELVTCSYNGENIKIKFNPFMGKINLERSELLKRLAERD